MMRRPQRIRQRAAAFVGAALLLPSLAHPQDAPGGKPPSPDASTHVKTADAGGDGAHGPTGRGPARREAVGHGHDAFGHGAHGDDLSTWSIGLSVAGTLSGASGSWPSARVGAVLQDGAVQRDRRGEPVLEGAALDARLRLSRRWRVELEASRHGDDPSHIERAVLAGRHDAAAQSWQLVAGRLHVPMGDVIDRAGHFDAFSRLPLAKEATVGHGWLEQGIGLDWQSTHLPVHAGAGLWRGERFPGSPGDRPAPSLRVGVGSAPGEAQGSATLFVAQARPDGRGSPQVRNGSFGHTHVVPDCAISQQNLVCLDGRSRLFGASAQWRAQGSAWHWSGAAIARRERGQLYSPDATADYRGLTHGGWLQASWRPDGTREFAVRVERLVIAHAIEGVGARRLAEQAGLAGAEPVSRIALAWHRAVLPALRIGLEAGRQVGAGAPPVNWASVRMRLATDWGD